MNKRTPSFVILTVLISILGLAAGIQKALAPSETIHIWADGSITPTGVPITSADNITYLFSEDIDYWFSSMEDPGLVIHKNNIILDGQGHTFAHTGGATYVTGIALKGVDNVEIRNLTIRDFATAIGLGSSASNASIHGNDIIGSAHQGIALWESSRCNTIFDNDIFGGDGIYIESFDNKIFENRIFGCNHAIYLAWSNNNSVYRNNLGNSHYPNTYAVSMWDSEENEVFENNVTDNIHGICLAYCHWNSIRDNNITSCKYGVYLWGEHTNLGAGNNTITGNFISLNNYGFYLDGTANSNNTIHHNIIADNNYSAYVDKWLGAGENVWDNGYPSGGNYWSDYTNRYPNATEIDSSGIGNTPYVVDSSNVDHYPLMNSIPEFPSFLFLPLLMGATLLAIVVCRKKARAR